MLKQLADLKLVRPAALALVLAFAAPLAAMVPAKSAPPVVYLPTIKLTLTARGKPHVYTVEVARSSDQQARGLMYRRTMARNHGMIFPMQPPRPASFWMENTYLPLDIVFIGAGNEVLNVVHGQPLSEDQLNSLGTTIGVLELNAGEAARIGLKPGDKVDYRL